MLGHHGSKRKVVHARGGFDPERDIGFPGSDSCSGGHVDEFLVVIASDAGGGDAFARK